MKISQMIEELQSVQEEHGDIEVALQDCPPPEELITGYELFFIVPEEYDDDGGGKAVVVCNIRWWPY